MIIENRSSQNIVSRDILHRLELPTNRIQPHTRSGGLRLWKIKTTECRRIPFSIGRYKDEVTCDIVDMDACHLLLGRPW